MSAGKTRLSDKSVCIRMCGLETPPPMVATKTTVMPSSSQKNLKGDREKYMRTPPMCACVVNGCLFPHADVRGAQMHGRAHLLCVCAPESEREGGIEAEPWAIFFVNYYLLSIYHQVS